MSQVFISILHRHHSSLVLIEHQEFAVTNFAYLAIDLLSVLQRDRVWKVARAQAAGLAVFHRAELAHIRLLKEILAAEAMCLFALYFVARCIIFHLELKDHLIRIESMRCSIYTNGHHCLHLLPLVSSLPLVLLLDLDHLIVREASARHELRRRYIHRLVLAFRHTGYRLQMRAWYLHI